MKFCWIAPYVWSCRFYIMSCLSELFARLVLRGVTKPTLCTWNLQVIFHRVGQITFIKYFKVAINQINSAIRGKKSLLKSWFQCTDCSLLIRTSVVWRQWMGSSRSFENFAFKTLQNPRYTVPKFGNISYGKLHKAL